MKYVERLFFPFKAGQHLNLKPNQRSPRPLISSPLPNRLRLPEFHFSRAHGIIFLLAILVLVSCTSSGGGDPAKAVAQYIQAKAAADQATMRGLLCSSMEANLEQEASSFAGLDAKVEDMACSRQGDSDIVSCTGKIVATYGTEATDFPLVSYKVVQEDGAWKWCGETASPEEAESP